MTYIKNILAEVKKGPDAAAFLCLVVSAFLMPFSHPGARIFLALAFFLEVYLVIKERRRVYIGRTVWIACAFILLAIVVTFLGVNPQIGVPKLRKFVWFAGMPLIINVCVSRERVLGILRSFACGTGVLALWICVANPILAYRSVCSGEKPDFSTAIIDLGSITNGQRLMVGIILVLGLLMISKSQRQRVLPWIALLCLQTLGILLMFKRGSWICTLAIVSIYLALKMHWKYVVGVLLVAGLAFLMPPVRHRVSGIADEFAGGKGGRMTMWTKIAPELIKEHPVGIGIRSLTNDMMRDIAPEVELRRDHLHSNFLQVLVATGWAGLALYIAWMASAVYDSVKAVISSRQRDDLLSGFMTLALLLMLVSLLLNGLVEYNLLDAEIVLIYVMVIAGSSSCMRHGQ